MDEFDAPQDRFVQSMTVLTFMLFVVLFIILVNADNDAGLLGLALIGLPVLLIAYLLAPTGYSVDESEIIIHRKIGTKKILLSNVHSVRHATIFLSPAKRVRTFGISGLFGYMGRFNSSELGHHIMYATDKNKGVLIEADKDYIISPDDPQRFIQVVKARLEG